MKRRNLLSADEVANNLSPSATERQCKRSQGASGRRQQMVDLNVAGSNEKGLKESSVTAAERRSRRRRCSQSVSIRRQLRTTVGAEYKQIFACHETISLLRFLFSGRVLVESEADNNKGISNRVASVEPRTPRQKEK